MFTFRLSLRIPKARFLAKNQHTYSKDVSFLILSMNVSSLKIEHDFSKKGVQKLTLEKKVFNKKWSPELIFLNEIFFFLNALIFDIKN